jgi:hypothetical protein
VAYSGPLRAQLTGARRAFSEQLDYERPASEVSDTFQLNVQLTWEDRLKLVAYRALPELVHASTDTGQALAAAQPGGSSWNVADAGTRQVAAVLKLQPPPAAARSLAELKLRWELIAVGYPATLETDDLAAGSIHYGDELQLTIEQVEQRPAGRWGVTLLVTRDLVAPDPQEILLHENVVQLSDAQGRPFEDAGQSNSLVSRGARIKVTFLAPAADAVPHRLRLTYPRIRAQRGMEIVFRDVPLPQGRPK